jgi:hypothetical protein
MTNDRDGLVIKPTSSRARRFLWLVLPSMAVLAILWLLPPAAFWIAGGLVIVACGVYADLQTRRELKR